MPKATAFADVPEFIKAVRVDAPLHRLGWHGKTHPPNTSIEARGLAGRQIGVMNPKREQASVNNLPM
jgi:hypothetical protein